MQKIKFLKIILISFRGFENHPKPVSILVLLLLPLAASPLIGAETLRTAADAVQALLIGLQVALGKAAVLVLLTDPRHTPRLAVPQYKDRAHRTGTAVIDAVGLVVQHIPTLLGSCAGARCGA